jgi:hypothetical protein
MADTRKAPGSATHDQTVRVRSAQGDAFLTVDAAGMCIDAYAVLREAVGMDRATLRRFIARNGWTATLAKPPPPAVPGAGNPGGVMADPLVRAILVEFPGADVMVTDAPTSLLAE